MIQCPYLWGQLWLRKIAQIGVRAKLLMIAKDFIPKMGAKCFAIMKYGDFYILHDHEIALLGPDGKISLMVVVMKEASGHM